MKEGTEKLKKEEETKHKKNIDKIKKKNKEIKVNKWERSTYISNAFGDIFQFSSSSSY